MATEGFSNIRGMSPGGASGRKPAVRLGEYHYGETGMYQELEGKRRARSWRGGLALAGHQQSRRGGD